MKSLFLVLAVFLVLACAVPAHAQLEIPHYASAPATCDVSRGLLYFDTGAKLVMFCVSTNTWAPLSASGGGAPAIIKSTLAASCATVANQDVIVVGCPNGPQIGINGGTLGAVGAVSSGTTAPGGSCSAGQIYFNTTTNGSYYCNGGAWAINAQVPFTALSASATLTATQNNVLATAGAAGITLTLPTAVGIGGTSYIVKRADSGAGNILINTTSAQTCDGVLNGSTCFSLVSQGQFVQLTSDGTNWRVANASTQQFDASRYFTALNTLDQTGIVNALAALPGAQAIPAAPALTTQTVGGSIGNGVTVGVALDYTNAFGRTPSSGITYITTGAGTTNQVTITGPGSSGNVTGGEVFACTGTGCTALSFQQNLSSLAGTTVLTSISSTGQVPSAVNSTGGGTVILPNNVINVTAPVVLTSAELAVPIKITGSGPNSKIIKKFTGDNIFNFWGKMRTNCNTTIDTVPPSSGDIAIQVVSTSGCTPGEFIVVADSDDPNRLAASNCNSNINLGANFQSSCSKEIAEISFVGTGAGAGLGVDCQNTKPCVYLKTALHNNYTAGTTTSLVQGIDPAIVTLDDFAIENPNQGAQDGFFSIEFTGCLGPSVRNLRVQIGGSSAAIHFDFCRDITVSNNEIRNGDETLVQAGANGIGIFIGDASYKASVTGNHLYECGSCINLTEWSEGIAVSGNTIQGCGDDCLVTHEDNLRDIAITGNSISGRARTSTVGSFSTTGIRMGGALLSDSHLAISGNVISHYGPGGIEIIPSSTDIGLITPPAPTLSDVAGGSLAATTYFVKITCNNARGESLPSTEASRAVAINRLLTVTAPACNMPNAGTFRGWNVYINTVTNTETKQNAFLIAPANNFTEQTTGLIAGLSTTVPQTDSTLYVPTDFAITGNTLRDPEYMLNNQAAISVAGNGATQLIRNAAITGNIVENVQAGVPTVDANYNLTGFSAFNTWGIFVQFVDGFTVSGNLVYQNLAGGASNQACYFFNDIVNGTGTGNVARGCAVSYSFLADSLGAINNFNWSNNVSGPLQPGGADYSFQATTTFITRYHSSNNNNEPATALGTGSTQDLFAAPQTFANLGTPNNGSQIFCTDCNATCTAGASTGRTCFRENGQWVH